MKIKKILKTVLLSSLTLCCGLSLACCNSSDTTPVETESTTVAAPSAVTVVRPEPNPSLKEDTVNKVGYQLEMPKDGDTIAMYFLEFEYQS